MGDKIIYLHGVRFKKLRNLSFVLDKQITMHYMRKVVICHS